MGYNTRYKVEMTGRLESFETEMIERKYITLEKLISSDVLGKRDSYNLFEEPTKWYECDENMKRFSAKHPNAVFILHGEGEESGDIWKAYYKNGKSVRIKPILTWPEYDESMLT